ncbi:transposase [Escherichia coli]|nr:transposase [Escherichia coli]
MKKILAGDLDYGLGASHSSGRVTVLSLIATLASIIMWLSGFSLENKGIHHKYQANTVKQQASHLVIKTGGECDSNILHSY